ncbi:hypothetical protein LAZ67_2003063, partial [Cordylochernes scorpioides]
MVDVNATKCKLEYAINDLMKMSDIFLQKLEDEDLNDEVENCIDKCIRLKCELDLRHNGQETSEKKVNLHVKMPKLELPTFDGGLESWLSFKDLFYSAIGSNSQIPEIEKLQYLKGQLRGEALRLVNAFPITADNYVEVWQTLLTRYDNPKDLIFTQIDNALRLPKLADDNHKSMFKLLDSCNEIVRTVKVLGYQIDSLSDVFFVEIIQDKLDKTTRKQWELQNNPRVVPSIKDLMEFLEIRAKSLQNLPNKDANVEKHSIRRESHKEMEESSIKRETAPRMEVQQKQWGHPGRSPMDYSSKRRPCRICLNRGHAGRFHPENRNFNSVEFDEKLSPYEKSDLIKLIKENKEAFAAHKMDIGHIKADPIRIKLTSQTPISLKPFRPSFSDNIEIKRQIEVLLKYNVIRPSYSSYTSPAMLVNKRNEGKIRLVIDYRKLNDIIKRDSEPIPRIDSILDKLSEANIFTTLDLLSGYHHLDIHPDDKEYTAFTTTHRLYEFNKLSFGLKNSPSQFQRVLRQILNKYDVDFCMNYFDDFIIFSNNFQEHLTHLKVILDICIKENIKLKLSKCKFATYQISFLGYEISNHQFSPSTNNIETIRKLNSPRNKKDLQRVLGSINIYSKFIPNYAKLRLPLNNLLKKDVKWKWDEECETAFSKLKNMITSKPILAIYNPKYPIHLYTDASQEQIVSILKQEQPDGLLKPIAYRSRRMTSYESNYCVTEQECLAIIDAVDFFLPYLNGVHFTIHADHACLKYLKNIKNPKGRLFRWSLKLSMFDFEIKHIRGTENKEADFLSRYPIAHFVSDPELKQAQFDDNINDRKYTKFNGLLTIKKKRINQKCCSTIIKRKNTVGGLNYYNSTKKFLHIIVDHATRYIWAFPSKSQTTDSYINCLNKIFQIQKPKQFLSDRAPSFTSPRFRKYLINNNIKQLLTSSSRPQCNGLNERLNQTIITRLRCKFNNLKGKSIPWTKLLDSVLNEYNNTPHSITGYTPTYLLYGKLPYDPPLKESEFYPPIDTARTNAYNNTLKFHQINKIRYDQHYQPSTFKVGDKVWLQTFYHPDNRKLMPPMSGPFTILKQISPVNYEIDKPQSNLGKTTMVIHSSKLRPYYSKEGFELKLTKSKIPTLEKKTNQQVAPKIQPPETFDFSTPNKWPKWRKRFERYLVVSGMKKKEEADKIDLFMYLMGDRADDIFRTFKFEKEEEATKIDSVLKAFDSHFCVRKNIIYERAKFNSRIQEDRKPVDEFITSLYKLADSCEFEGLHEQLIRDRIVVGVRDKALSERMQLDSELTLENAVKMVRQQEAVRQQQVDLQRPSTSQKVNQVKFNSKKQSPKQQQQPLRKKEKSAKTRSRCPKCGGFNHREGQACRAEGQKCNLCSKTGHFANCCPDKHAKTAELKAVSDLDEEIGFLLEVSAVEDSSNLDDDEVECRRRWTAEIQVNGKQVKFKLDSQADVTCVPLCLFKKIMGQQRLVESDINIRAAEFSELQTVGMFISTLRNDNYEIKEKIYAIRRLSEPLLSRRACELLNLARRIEVVATRINPIKEFPEVFEGLEQIGNPYEIKLKPGAKPYAVHSPRGIMTPTEKRYAQIKKEALVITWACERFQDFLLGKSFRIETDHKPLIPLFSTKELSSLTPRLQRFRMRMMFGFEIVHIPGKELLDADALSRQPLLTTEGGEDERPTSAHINAVLSSITDKDEMLTKIFEAQQEDTTLKAVVNYLEQGWPDKKKMSQALLSYWHIKDELGVQNGLLMRICRLVIPASMKLEILDKLHAGHFGITKTRLCARETVWWPGISEEIAETVRKCSVCIQEAVSKQEPLIPTNFPTRPWQKIGMDLFKFENKWYLVVIDYYSRFPEMIQLDRLTANVVVRSCKSIFARHGVPETVVSDNGTQFGAAREFANFARQYGFTHVTSSPRFPQSNGMAEAGVKMAKLILKKNQDPSLGLLEYRSTPLENGYSPAELLMGRKLRTTLPIAPENLNPKLVDSQTLKRKEGRRRNDMKSRYDRRCGATDMEELSEGDTLWITDMRIWGIVKQKPSTPRSYMVDTPVGTLCRNRLHLRKGDTVQYPADPSTPTFSGEELVNRKCLRIRDSLFYRNVANLLEDDLCNFVCSVPDSGAVPYVLKSKPVYQPAAKPLPLSDTDDCFLHDNIELFSM